MNLQCHSGSVNAICSLGTSVVPVDRVSVWGDTKLKPLVPPRVFALVAKATSPLPMVTLPPAGP